MKTVSWRFVHLVSSKLMFPTLVTVTSYSVSVIYGESYVLTHNTRVSISYYNDHCQRQVAQGHLTRYVLTHNTCLNFFLFESMLDTVIIARDKWLKETSQGTF